VSFIAIIPARAGSKGVPNKNIRKINGKPLIVWSIEQALANKNISRVLVSTDSKEIAQIAQEAGAEVPSLRPSELAEDATPTEPVLLHAIDHWCQLSNDDVVILLQATSPLRLQYSLDMAIDIFVANAADSLVSVCESHAFFWKNPEMPTPLYDFQSRPRRQDILPENRWYRENGSIYLTKVGLLRSQNNRLGGKIVMHVMQECESWEIDTEADFLIVEELMRRNNL
jgi:CMP-N,N'-diacetyllegionaminic acid synthase